MVSRPLRQPLMPPRHTSPAERVSPTTILFPGTKSGRRTRGTPRHAAKAPRWPRKKFSMRASRQKRRKIWREKLGTATKAINGRWARPMMTWPKCPNRRAPGRRAACAGEDRPRPVGAGAGGRRCGGSGWGRRDSRAPQPWRANGWRSTSGTEPAYRAETANRIQLRGSLRRPRTRQAGLHEHPFGRLMADA
jgi:hypothetical protein